jgi:hypothetical protein
MNRSTAALAILLTALVSYQAFGRGSGASAADPAAPHRLIYVFVSGKGPQAKAWYDGGPPQGAQVQGVLDAFTKDGFRYAAISSSGVASRVNVSNSSTPGASADATPEAEYVVLLER